MTKTSPHLEPTHVLESLSQKSVYILEIEKRRRSKYIIFLMYLHGKQFKTHSNPSLWTLSLTNCIGLVYCLSVCCCVTQRLFRNTALAGWRGSCRPGQHKVLFGDLMCSYLASGCMCEVTEVRKWSCSAVLADALAGTGRGNQNRRGIN